MHQGTVESLYSTFTYAAGKSVVSSILFCKMFKKSEEEIDVVVFLLLFKVNLTLTETLNCQGKLQTTAQNQHA